MHSALQDDAPGPISRDRVTKFTNCRLLKGNELVQEDLWISSITGKIIRSQEAFYDHHMTSDDTVNLGGRIVCPGFIDVQLNGAFGFDFSVVLDDMSMFAEGLSRVRKALIQTGVTSYLPTLTSQRSEVYQKVIPYLGPSGMQRIPEDGTESLGVHCEGPFLSPTKNGIHSTNVLVLAPRGFQDLEDCYGADNLREISTVASSAATRLTPIKMITAAPEIDHVLTAIPEIVSRDIVFSMGHSEATYEQASAAVEAGATMVTHLFNAMRPLHHRNPGIFGVLGKAESISRPYFGIIADGIHLHPTSVRIAFNAHPDGCILVTDAMKLLGLGDGVYDWTNGDRIVKTGALLMLEGSNKIAGSTITLIDCVSNFLNWTGSSIAEALKAVTSTPAKMLGLTKTKGTLDGDADADVVILREGKDEHGAIRLVVDQVWKFGVKVFEKESEQEKIGLSAGKRDFDINLINQCAKEH